MRPWVLSQWVITIIFGLAPYHKLAIGLYHRQLERRLFAPLALLRLIFGLARQISKSGVIIMDGLS